MEVNQSNEMENVRDDSRINDEMENARDDSRINNHPETSNVEQSEREKEEFKNMLEDGFDELLLNALREYEEEMITKKANEELNEIRKQSKKRKDDDGKKIPSKKKK